MALGLCFTACSDDDDPVIEGGDNNEEVIIKELLGDYVGVKNLILKDDYSPKIHHVAQLLKGEEGDEYNLVLPFEIEGTKAGLNVSRHGGMPSMGKIVLDDVELTKEEDGSYTYTDDEEDVNSGEIKAKITELKVSIKETAMKISWKFQPEGMPFALNYSFEGDKNEKIVPMPSFAEAILKTQFKGVLQTQVKGEKQEPDSCIVKIFGQNNGKFTVRLPKSISKKAKSSRGMEMPMVEIKDVEFTAGAENTYTYTSGAKEVPTPAFVVKLDKINLKIKGTDMDFTFDMQPGNMPLWINNAFTTNFQEVEPEKPEVSVDAHEIEGTYVGDNKMIVNGRESVLPNTAIKITAISNDAIQLFIPSNEPARAMSMPDVTLDNIKVVGSEEGSYTFTLAEKVLNLDSMTITLKNVKGTVKGDKLDITYVAEPKGMPMPINFVYSGTKKEETENPDASVKEQLVGKYVGENSANIMGEEQKENAFMTIAAQENGKFTLQIPETIIAEGEEKPAMSMPVNVFIKDLEAVKEGEGSYSLSTSKCVTEGDSANGKMSATITNMKAKVSNGKVIEVEYTMTAGAMPFAFTFNFKGNKEAK